MRKHEMLQKLWHGLSQDQSILEANYYTREPHHEATGNVFGAL